MRWKTTLIICCCVVLITGNPCQAESPLEDAGLLKRDFIIAEAASVTLEQYPNAESVLVDDYILARYETDGTSVEWDDTYVKVLTEKGRREQQSLAWHFTIPYSTVSLLALEIIKPDGTLVPIDIKEQSKVAIDSSQMSLNIYNPNDKLLLAGVPGLEVGDVVHYLTRRDAVKPLVPNSWSDYQLLEYTDPLRHFLYEVQAPRELPLKSIAIKDPVPGTVKSDFFDRDDRIIYRWEVSDVPRVYNEPDMPSFERVVQRLLVSTFSDWAEISDWYWKISQPHLEKTTPGMVKKVEELTAGLSDSREKIEAIFHWVAQEVRYLGITIEDEAPGYEPHDVDLSFEKRHGVCRDKAALLVSMLRLAGFNAYPVLIYLGPKKDEEVPQPWFNHAVSCVEQEDGSCLLMDSTAESTKDVSPAFLGDRSYLVAKPGGEGIKTSPIVPAEKNMMLIETRGGIDKNGNLQAETQLTFEGANDLAYRGAFARMKPEERRRYIESVLKKAIAGARVMGFEMAPADLLNMAEPLSIRVSFEAEDMLVGEGDIAMLELPRLATRIGMVNFILGKTGLKKREFPLKTDLATGVREEVFLQLSPALGKIVSLPKFTPCENETVSWKRTLEFRGTGLESKNEFLIRRLEISPEQYLELKEDLKNIEQNDRKLAIFSRVQTPRASSPGADVVVLSHLTEYQLSHSRQWREKRFVKKKVLTYKGKKDHSELKISYNPAWEEVRILKASVTNGNKTEQVGDVETNLMDADWVGSAPRYPAEKRLIINLPGVEIGSIIEYEYELIRKKQPFFSATHVFRGYDPVLEKVVKLSAPETLDIRVLLDQNGVLVPDDVSGEQAPAVNEKLTRSDGKVFYEWTARDQKAVPKESNVPPFVSFGPMLRISTGRWIPYAREILSLLTQASRDQEKSQSRAKDLVKGIVGAKERIGVIRDFVLKSIRLAGPGLEEMPFEAITSADRTLLDGYGNTSDRAVLLYSMLEAVGYEPEFVLASRSSRIRSLQVFNTDYGVRPFFNKVLVKLSLDGEAVYLNDTNHYAVIGTTQSDGYLEYALGSGQIDVLRAPEEKRDRAEREYKVSIARNGTAEIFSRRRTYGFRYASSRKDYEEMSPEERRRRYEELVSEISQAAEAKGELSTDYESYPGEESFSVTVDNYAIKDGKFLYFTLPKSLKGLLGLDADKREVPFYRSNYYRFQIVTDVAFPEGYRVVLSPKAGLWKLPSDSGTVDIEIKKGKDGRSMSVIYTVDLLPAVIDEKYYPELLEVSRKLSELEAQMVLLIGAPLQN